MPTAGKCDCGNPLADDDQDGMCNWCYTIADEPQHAGHYSMGGGWWCDTCNSPLCNLI